MHPHESLIRTHVEGGGSEHERQEVDEHLKDCSDCQEFLSFVQDLAETAKELSEDEIAADEPHPRKSVIIAYEEGKLDAETSLNLAKLGNKLIANQRTLDLYAYLYPHNAGGK